MAEEYYNIPKEERSGKVQVTASTSFFVPKPFTPFQWARMCTKEEFLERAHIVNSRMKEMLNRKSLRYNWHEADLTVLEGDVYKRQVLTQGSILLLDVWTSIPHSCEWFGCPMPLDCIRFYAGSPHRIRTHTVLPFSHIYSYKRDACF